jgi:hypothetical protein
VSAREEEILADGFALMSALLQEGPGIELSQRNQLPRGTDRVWQVQGDHYNGTVLVEVFERFTPRSVDRLIRNLSPDKLSLMNTSTVLVVAPWLSPRSRELILERGWSYLDLTGNVFVRMPRPALYLRTPGAAEDPLPRPQSDVQLRGSRINALVRVLADVEPPYRLVDLTRATGLSAGYVSRALTALHDQQLIDRAPAGAVEQVHWAALLRQRANEYDLFKNNRSATFLARSSPVALLKQLPKLDNEAVVTGSFAVPATELIVAPAQLALYVHSIPEFAARAELMPTTSGANVVLLEPSSPSQIDRPRLLEGIPYAGLSQLVMDLLAGNGRLPEEGEALLEWMATDTSWRTGTLPDATPVA